MRRMRKPSTKKAKYSYDPELEQGYAILRNLDSVEDVGTAIQSHDRYITSQIDSRAAEYWRQNAEELKWEKRKEEINQDTESIANTPFVFGAGQMNPISLAGAKQQNLLEAEIRDKQLPNQPEDYGYSDFLKDQWNSFFSEMNDLQAKDAEGYKFRANVDRNLIKKYLYSLDTLDEIDNLNVQINQINQKLGEYGLTVEERNSLRGQAASLIEQRDLLKVEYDSMAGDRKQLEDTVNTGGIKSAWNDLMSGNGIYGNSVAESIFGKTTAAHDELNDARRFIYDLGNGKRSRQETRQMLNRAMQEYDTLEKGWNAVIEENEKDAKYHKDKISKWFQDRADRTQIAFTDPDTYLFKMPGIIGGSSSSYMKQAPAMLAAILGSFAGFGGIAAGAATSFMFNYGAGISENNAEVALAAREKIKERAGLTDEDINAMLDGKLTDIKKLRAISENISNVENLFNKDMAATTWDAAVDAVLSTVPIGAMAKANSFIRGTKAWKKATANPVLKKVLESTIGQDIKAGWEAGSMASPLVGVGTAAANATIGKAARVGAENLGNILVQKADETWTGAIARSLGKRMQLLSKGTSKLRPDLIDEAKALKKGLNSQYMKGIGGRLIKSAIAEGIEEGKQHVNAEEFKKSLTDPNIMSTMDVAFTDMVNGLTMGAYVLGIPLDGLGIINIKDQDLLQEIKGGMLGGWGQTGTVTVAKATIPYLTQHKAIDIAIEAIQNNKLASTAQRNQYRDWLRRGLLNPSEGQIKHAFQMLREQNDKYEQIYHEKPIAPELIDEAEKKYDNLINLAQNPITKQFAQANGIKVRDWSNPTSWRSNSQYHDFVATTATALDRIDDIKQNHSEAVENRIKTEQKWDAMLGVSDEGLAEILSYLQADEGTEKKTNGLPIVTGEGIRYQETPFEKAIDQIDKEGSHDFAYTRMIAQLAALLKYRQEIETGLRAQENTPHSKVRRGLKNQLKRLNEQINLFIDKNEKVLVQQFAFDAGVDEKTGAKLSNRVNFDKHIKTLEDVENHLAYNTEAHEELRDAYIEELKWRDELSSAQESFDNFFGKQETDEDGNKTFTKGNALEILQDIKDAEDADDAFEQTVEQVFQEQLKAEHLDDQNAWVSGEIDLREKRPVNDANGNQIQVRYDEQGRMNRRLADNETVDDMGYLWEYRDRGAVDNPANRMGRVAPTPQDNAELDRQLFRDSWNKMNGETLPLTPEGLIERRQRQLFEAARANGGFQTQSPPSEDHREDYKGMVERYYETRNRLVPPPIPPTPPSEIRPEEPNDDPQDTVIKEIERRYEEDKQIVQNDPEGYHTTSQDYFIEQNGKVIRASRVHNVKPEAYVHEDEQKEVNEIYNDLLSSKSLGELTPKIPEYIADIDKLGEIDPYIEYLEENESVFFGNPTADTTKEYKETLRNIAQAIINSNKQTSSSILVGNIVDELSRNFFGSDVLYNMSQTEKGMRQLFNQETVDGRTYNELYRGNFDAFASLIRQMQGTYEYYTRILGWKLTTLPFTLRAQFDNIGWVAGQTDMIGVDKNGRIHIIDFKTSKYTFGSQLTPNIQLTEIYQNDLKILEEKDFYTPDGFQIKSAKAKRILKAIKNDGNKNIDIEWKGGRAVISNKTKPFYGLPNQAYGQQLSAYEDYSNQQTAYAEMLKANGFDVASIEILPFKVSYDYEFTEPGKGIVRIDLEDRMPLMLSSKMKSILDGVETREEQSINTAREELHNNIGHLQYKIDNFVEKITDEVFDELSDQGKILYSDFLSEVKNAVEEASILLYDQNSRDIDALNAKNDAIEAILERFDAFLKDMREDIKLSRSKAAQQAINESKREQQKKREPQQESGPVVGSVYAKNKRDSAGNTTRSNLNYVRVNSDPELTKATMAPNFIDDADITLYVEGDDIYADIQFEGKTWQRVMIDAKYNGTWIPNSKKLHDDIERMQIEHPGAKIVPVKSTMTRTNGRILLNTDKNGHFTYKNVTDTDLFAGQDIYDIEFSAAYGALGFVDESGQIITFDGSETQRKPIGQWSNVKMASEPGTLIYKKPTPKNERKNSHVYVAIDRVKLTEGDINFIIEALKNPIQLDRPYYKEINGKQYNLHATPRQIINLLLPLVDDPSQLGNADSIIRDPRDSNVVYIMKRKDLAFNNLGRGRFDLSTAEGINSFIQTLSTMSIAERHDVLNSRLGQFQGNQTSQLPFGGIKQFFIEQNGNITALNITDTIKFDLEDFKSVTAKSGVKRQGVNGFAYYLKHGMLRTQYNSMGSANVEIKEAMIDNGKQTSVSPNGINDTQPIGSVSTVIDSSAIDDSLFKVFDGKASSKLLSEDKARKHIAEILGENVPVEFQRTFIRVASGAAHVIGNCKTDAIILSSLAFPGVEYHEAFHRIFELLIPSIERDRIYNKIATRLGLQLYNQDGKENKDAFRQVAEYAADHYMNHMNYHMTDLKIPFLTKIYNKIHDWVSVLLHFSDRELYRTFIRVNKGEYRNAKPSQASIDRFNRLYSELHCSIHGIQFDHIVNRPMYDSLRQNVMFCILQGQNVDQSGRNIQEIGKHINKEAFLAGVEKMKSKGIDIFGETTDIPTVGQLAMKELYDNFDNDVLRDDIANDISVLSTDFVKEFDEQSKEDAQGDDVTNANIGEHTRSSYEFSRFSKTSSRVRFFFATIPDTKYERVTETLEDGKQQVKLREVYALNELGLPQYAPVHAVFNEFLNLFHDIDTLSELMSRLEYFAKTDPLYNRLYKAIDKIYKTTYSTKDGVITRNSDQEALLVQLMNVIRSNKHNFDIARSTTTNNGNGMHRITIQTTDADYNATFYPTQWNQMLVNGGTPIIKVSYDGSLQFNKAFKGIEYSFERISDTFSHGAQVKTAENNASYNDVGIKEWLINTLVGGEQNMFLRLKINGKYAYYNNPKNPEQLEVVKDKIVEMLNMLGIQISGDEFNYMLKNKYGSSDYEALAKIFTSTAKSDSITSFLQFLKNVAPNGKLQKEVRINGKQVKLENAYAKLAFVRELANWKYQYRHSHDQLTVLATDNNKFYEISDNNYASDVARMINKRTEELDELLSDSFAYFEGEEDVTGEKPVYGSVILKEITRNPNTFITLRNFVGFKTDKRGDYGSDYFKISKREDYVSKATILESGGIIMPTLSDKKTWLYVDGIKLPGLDYSNTIDDNGNTIPMSVEQLGDQFVISPDPISQLDNVLSQKEEVIDQFISYAYSEYEAIKKADRDIDQMEKNGTKSEEVENYYRKDQGAKFSSLLGVWIYTYKKNDQGQNVISGETFKSFNNNKRTRKQNIQEAEKYFFSQPKEVQQALIARLLHKRLLKEIDNCVELGLIRRIDDSGNIFGDYENIGLNNQALDVIYKSIVAKNGNPVDAISTSKYKSLAVMIYLNDISNKAIMSGQEIERVFSGNPAFYGWKYDEKTGSLIDRTVDELKRLGGIVSTGNNNFTELKDVPAKYLDENGNFKGTYICAEVDNELIESPQISEIQDRMEYGEILTAAYNAEENRRLRAYKEKYDNLLSQLNNGEELSQEDYDWIQNANPKTDEQQIRKEVSDMVDSVELEDLKKLLDPTTLAIAQRKAKEATDSYRLKYKDGKVDKGIDVADGSAYITDTMAEMLLRMNGNYSTDIQNAFDILRNKPTASLMKKYKAYQQVVTAVIGSQKYTAFGRRKHAQTGTQIAYYNKMALFPLFKCMATGKMANVYDKMMQQGIDMLMVNSAVKVGSQGSKAIDWNSYESFQFNTYEQKFMYLRKQLNTDPKEETMMGVGTQMTKVVMSSLFDGRTYYMQDGTELSGEELRNDIMDAINTLSNRGLHNIVTRFFKTDKDGSLVDKDGNKIDDNSPLRVLDEEKFSKEVRNMMMSKDPDRNILDGLELVEQIDKDGNVTKHMRLPLNAISNSNWLESVLISSINKKVVDIETPGAAFIQRSVWNMEGSTLVDKISILSDEDIPTNINGGNRLQMINEEGSMDCVLSFDFIKKMFKGILPVVPIKDENRNLIWDLIPETDKNGKAITKDGKIVYKQKRDKDGNPMVDKEGKPIYKRKIRTREMSFDEARQWLINRGIIGPKATANIIGYRIPTQAQSSIHALRCVDILPVVNDTVILPAEFTKITGSDFDIDKLFLSSIQYSVSREEGEDGKFHQTVSDKFEKNSSAYYQNKLLKDYIAILLDWTSHTDKRQRTTNILHRSIDNDTKLLKDIIEDIEENKPVKAEEPYEFYSLSTQTASKDDYITGKVGIGPFALNNNNHILTMMYHVRFKHVDSGILSALGLESLDNREDRDKESIMSWISALINAHVDIAKDPYISRLNVNPFTYNLVNLLVRTGMGKKTFYFTYQPIMKELAKAYINAGSLYMADPHKSKYKLQQEAVDEFAEKYFEELGEDAKNKIKVIKEGGSKNARLRVDINADIAKMFNGDDLITSAKSNTVDKNQQLLVYLAYLQLDKYATALSNLVKYSKIDTKKHGKSIVEQMIYHKGYQKTFDTIREESPFEPIGLDAMQNDSYIATKTDNAINSTSSILSSQFIQSTPAFQGTVDKILKAVGREESLSVSLVTKVVNALSAAVKSKFFVDTYVPSITTNPNYLHDLVSESQEYLDFKITQNGTVIELDGKPIHNLRSYCNGGVAYIVHKGKDGNMHQIQEGFVLTGADPATNRISINKQLVPMSGKILIKGGENTIYDRFMRLQTLIATDPRFAQLRSESGDITNRLLQMIVPGTITEYKKGYVVGEHPDTYETSKFIKLFNFVEDSGNTANYIIDGWDELLQYTDPEHPEVQKAIREFARDLIVYAFITSGDRGGFTKMFKYVPVSWREESGYGQFIHDKLAEYSIGFDTDIDIDDVLLNNWYDNELVPTYYLEDRKTKSSNFMKYYTKRDNVRLGFPTILAALHMKDGALETTIDPATAPRYIKIPRRSDYSSSNSQRRATVYKLHRIAVGKNGIEYPVYIKVNPKGNQINGGFMITEYGRTDAIVQPEYTINEEVLQKTYQASTVADHINSVKRTEPEYAAIMEGLNRAWNKEQEQKSGVTDREIQERRNQNFDDSQFSDEAMKHCKS